MGPDVGNLQSRAKTESVDVVPVEILMTNKKSKIVTEKKDFTKFWGFFENSNGNGTNYPWGGSCGDGFGDGRKTSMHGNSSGAGSGNFKTCIVDPDNLTPLKFYGKRYGHNVSWDEIWEEASYEEKKHLILFLPLRDK